MTERKGTKGLELWCKKMTEGYPGVKVENMTTSWRDGLAFCAIIHHFRPELIDFAKLNKDDVYRNNELAFRVAEKYLGIPALLEAEDMVEYPVPDRLSILTYLSQFYQVFACREGSPSRIAAKRTASATDRGIVSPASTSPPTKMEVRGVGVGVPRRLPCAKCSMPVFIAERLNVGSLLYHRTCFRCARCGGQLNLASCYETETEGQYCCEVCPDEEKQPQPPVIERSLSDEEKSAAKLCVPETTVDFSSCGKSDEFLTARSHFFSALLDDAEDSPPPLPDSGPPDLSVNSFISGNQRSTANTDVIAKDCERSSLVKARMRLFQGDRTPQDDSFVVNRDVVQAKNGKTNADSAVVIVSDDENSKSGTNNDQISEIINLDSSDSLVVVSSALTNNAVSEIIEVDSSGTDLDFKSDSSAKVFDSSANVEDSNYFKSVTSLDSSAKFADSSTNFDDSIAKMDDSSAKVIDLSPKSAKVIGLSTKIDDSSAKPIDLNVKIDDSSAKVHDLSVKFENSNEAIDSSPKIMDSSAKVIDLSPKINVSSAKVIGLSVKNDGSSAKVTDLSEKNHDSNAKADHLGSKVDDSNLVDNFKPNSRVKIADSNAKIQDSRSKVDNSSAKIIDSSPKIVDSSAKVVDFSAEVDDSNVKVKIEEISSKVDDSNAKIVDSIAPKVVDSSAKPEDVDSRSNIVYSNAKIVDSSANIEDSSAKVIDLSPQVIDSNTKVHHLSANVVDSNVKVEDSSVKVDDLKLNVEDSNAKVANFQDSNTNEENVVYPESLNPFGSDDEMAAKPTPAKRKGKTVSPNVGETKVEPVSASKPEKPIPQLRKIKVNVEDFEFKRSTGDTPELLRKVHTKRLTLGPTGDEVISKPLLGETGASTGEGLNPFGSDDEEELEQKTSENNVQKLSSSSHYEKSLNPFGDEESEGEEEPPKLRKIKPSPDEFVFKRSTGDTPEGLRTVYTKRLTLGPSGTELTVEPVLNSEDANHRLNPFGSDDEEETDLKRNTLASPGRGTLSSYYGSSASISSGTSSVPSTRKKKPAPRPPIPAEFHLSPQQSPIPSLRGSPKPRKNKRAPLPPLTTSTPLVIKRDLTNANESPGTLVNTCDGTDLHKTKTEEANDLFVSVESGDYENEKVVKDEVNRNRQNQSGNEGRYVSATPNKSTYGKWKRKKGQAPTRPVPEKRTIKALPTTEVRRELDIIEVQQQGLERQGVRLEEIIRERCEGPGADPDGAVSIETEDLILQLFEVVNEKNELCRRQAELMYLQRQHRLEEEYAEVEYQIRCLMLRPALNKTDYDKEREEELIARLVDIVERRNEIIECLEIDRIREAEEDDSISVSLNNYAAKREETSVVNEEPKKEKKSKKKFKKFKFRSSPKVDADKDVDESESSLSSTTSSTLSGKEKKKERKFRLF